MFCTKCGARIDDNAGFCSECGNPVAPFAGSRPETAPLEGKDREKPSPRTGTEKKLLIVLCALVAAILVVVILLVVVAKPWGDKGGNREETDIERDRDEEEDAGAEQDDGEPEGEEETSPGAADVLQACLDNELAGQYGYADLGTKIVSFAHEGETTDTSAWTGLSGIADARILDLDGDGQEELLVICLEGQNICLWVYEAEENTPVKKAEAVIERSGDGFSHEDVFTLAGGGDTVYLVFLQAYWGGIWSDGYYAQTGLYQYDGERLYTPLTIQQDGQGSSEFVYIARQYDGNGAQLSEEVVYDNMGYHGAVLEEDHCLGRMKELFGNYGIAVGDQATMQIYGGNFDNFLAPGGDSQTLMRLQMQAEWGKASRNANTEMRQRAVFTFNGYRAPFRVTGWEDDEYGYLFDGTKLLVDTGDGREMELTLAYPGTVEKVEYMDITGDGVEEAVVTSYLYNTGTEYYVMDFLKMESGRVTDMSPWKDMPELSEEWWDMEIAEPSREGYTSPIYKLSSYGKEDGMAFVENEILVGYKEGRWQEVQ